MSINKEVDRTHTDPSLETEAPQRFDLRNKLSSPSLRTWSSRYAVILVWALMTVGFMIASPDVFARMATFQNIFGSQQVLVFLALGALCTLVVGEFDLAIASTMGLSATIVPVLVVLNGVSVPVAIGIALSAAVLAGLLNALVVVKVGVNALVATLGTGTLFLGLASWISSQTTVGGLDAGLGQFVRTSLFGLPVSFYYGVVLALIFAYVLAFTPIGRYMTFIGANREVARLAGINVDLIRIGSYVVGATIAGVGGVLLVLSTGGYDATASQQYLLPAFAAAFLGTAVVRPGTFNPIGALVAIYFLATGIVGLQVLGLSGWIQDVFYGGALVIAVSVSAIVQRRSVGS